MYPGQKNGSITAAGYALLLSLLPALIIIFPAGAQVLNCRLPGCTSKVSQRATQYYLRAWDLAQKQKVPEALEFVNMALAQDKSYGAAVLLQADLLARLEKPKEAIAAYKAGLALMPDCADHEVFGMYAGVLHESGDDKAALAAYNKGISRDKGALLLVSRADLLMKMGQTKNALADCEEAIKRAPTWQGGYQVRGRINFELKQYDKAIVDCKKRISLVPGDSSAYTDLGNALKALGKNKEAEKAYRESDAIGAPQF